MRYISTAKQAIADLRGGGRGKALLAVAFGWFLSISVRMIYPALLPHLRDAYGLTLTTAGLLLTVLWVAYACGQLPGGILADWVGERLLLIASSLSAATMLVLVVVANSSLVLFGATALFGLGTALYGVSRFTILNEIYPDQLGTATGVTLAAGDLGNAIMPPAAGFIAVTVAWQYSFGAAVPLFVFAAIGLWATLPRPESATTSLSESLALDGVVSTLLRPNVLRGTVLLMLWSVIMQVFIGFYPTYLIDEKGLSATVATVLFGFFFALGILMKPIAGRAYDRIGVQFPLLVIMGVTSIALGALPFVEGVWLFVPLTVLVSSVLGFETIVISDLTRRLPDGTRGTNLGALRTVYIGLGALSPVLFGAVADRGYFDQAFLGVAGLAGVVVLIVLVSVEY
ncbi:putative 3-hydroxyphenylpropionic transporter MhpT [Halalkalicoccus paucihalophilus]|uniref:Putative 3-hydroxyphenylpropionic transporter MhpT n=1 Tax=Halalkalicoccus paucihalophilus TaxID=1008153 RepID=A0A151AFH7_9EURY|nr:MFS transporter [Halalkalicoccus paucihalophilus]KYH26409.1 putative 3-hydroxyphenylpropionic transporter MhpT [Halalkalicoccus paucihalophilus]